MAACGGNASGGSGGSGGGPSCGDATGYDGANHATNAARELDIKARHAAINGAMLEAELDATVTPTAAELGALWAAGSPALQSLASGYHDAYALQVFDLFEAAAGNTWTPSTTPEGPGGLYGKYLFDARGVDLRQAYEKTMFGAVFHLEAYRVAKEPLTLASLDRLLALFGAHPSFPGNSDAADPVTNPNPDRLAAQYAERRSPKDPSDPSQPLDPAAPGPYFRIRDRFVEAQGALATADPTCAPVAEAAVATILDEWERAMMATVAYYFFDAATKLSTDGASDETLAAGLHGYNEGVAFLRGYRGLPEGTRTISDAQIDAMLALVGQPVDGEATSHRFLTDAAAEVPKLLEAIDQLGAVYGWTASDLELFQTNF